MISLEKMINHSLLLRLPVALFSRLRSRAEIQDVSINSLCISILGKGLDERLSSSAGVLMQIVEMLQAQWGEALAGIVLFGSEASGRARDTSDIDLLIVLAPGTEINRALYSAWDSVKPDAIKTYNGREISPHFVELASDENSVGSLWFECALNGVILFDRGHVTELLSKIRAGFAKSQFVRKTSYGHGYWVRQ